MRILLTGASGRLGSATLRLLHEKQRQVLATDRFFRRDLPVPIRIADLLNRDLCYSLLEGIDVVVHLANHAGYRSGDEQRVFNENVAMNMNIFQAAHQLGVQRIIYASSIQAMSGRRQKEHGGVADLPGYLPWDGDAPANPANPYALSKHVGEQMLQYYARYCGMDAVALRFPLLPELYWISHLKADPSHGDINEAFSFLMVDDAAALIEAILRTPMKGYRCYFPAARGNIRMKPAAEMIREFYAEVPLRRPIEQIDSLVDISGIERETGWTPRFSEL